ncbi:hypothetical protein E2C01_050382 [Portunus trituberculatus]|uniref:Uncharacterized protein n=1 Tax=Portunus trituberculatus TaxID=210409 RepID=A0A5B7G8T5_PORTR|nr:hypothetical protein [Portunus trituberculatus]
MGHRTVWTLAVCSILSPYDRPVEVWDEQGRLENRRPWASIQQASLSCRNTEENAASKQVQSTDEKNIIDHGTLNLEQKAEECDARYVHNGETYETFIGFYETKSAGSEVLFELIQKC